MVDSEDKRRRVTAFWRHGIRPRPADREGVAGADSPGGLLGEMAHTVATKSTALVAGLALTLILARTFTPAEYGIYGLVAAIGWIAGPVGGLLLHAYVQRVVPGRQDSGARILKTTLLGEFLLTGVTGALVVGSGLLGVVLRWSNAEPYFHIFALVFAYLALAAIQQELLIYVYARMQVRWGNLTELVGHSLWVIPVAGAWAIGAPVTLELILASMIGATVLSSFVALRHVPVRAVLSARADIGVLRSALLYSVPLVLPALNYGLLRFFDRFVLAAALGPAAVGVYTFAFTVVNMMFTFSHRILYTSMVPRIMEAHNRGEPERRGLLLTYMLKSSLAGFVLLSVGFLLVGEHVLRLVARPEYAGALPLVGGLAISTALLIASMPAQVLLQCQDRTTAILGIEFAALGLAVTADIALIPVLGVWGAIVAAIVVWAFVVAAKWLAARAWKEVVWSEVWTLDREIRTARAFLTRGRLQVRNS